MHLNIKHTDVLDITADALIYSTNVMLNCTGGCGACLAERYGWEVQVDLHNLLKRGGHANYAEKGTVYQHVTEGLPYKRVYHTVPCDGFYDTSVDVVSDVLRRSLTECVDSGIVNTVALSVLATGYGHLEFADFFRLASTVLSEEYFAGLESATIGIQSINRFTESKEQIINESLPFNVME